MLLSRLVLRTAGLCALSACVSNVELTPPPAASPAWVVAQSGATVMIGAGDIASCTTPNDEATARLVDSVLVADSVAKVPDVVFTLGDNVYESGTATEFARCFTPSWGDPAKRIMKNVRPAPGNHDYRSPGAAPYFAYFGEAAGKAGEGYYSYKAGEWHVVVLNSEIIVNPAFSDAARSAQMAWLEKDLSASTALCTRWSLESEAVMNVTPCGVVHAPGGEGYRCSERAIGRQERTPPLRGERWALGWAWKGGS